MADENEEEPSIEEILDSIKQIISDDDEEGGDEPVAAEEPAAAEPAPEPEAEPETPAEPEPEPEITLETQQDDEEVLELTPEMQETQAKPDIALQDAEDGPVLSDDAKSAALASMAKLAGSMPVTRKEGYDGVTVEDIVRELLNPVIREWADKNLGGIVEQVVQKEISKLSRRALDE